MDNYEKLKQAGLITPTVEQDADGIFKDALNLLEPPQLVDEIIKAWGALKYEVFRHAGLTTETIDQEPDWKAQLNALPDELVIEILRAGKALREEGGQDFS